MLIFKIIKKAEAENFQSFPPQLLTFGLIAIIFLGKLTTFSVLIIILLILIMFQKYFLVAINTKLYLLNTLYYYQFNILKILRTYKFNYLDLIFHYNILKKIHNFQIFLVLNKIYLLFVHNFAIMNLFL